MTDDMMTPGADTTQEETQDAPEAAPAPEEAPETPAEGENA